MTCRRMALSIAVECGLASSEYECVELAALLHDVGDWKVRSITIIITIHSDIGPNVCMSLWYVC